MRAEVVYTCVYITFTIYRVIEQEHLQPLHDIINEI